MKLQGGKGIMARVRNNQNAILCSDANLIEILVEVETPNHHYYHVALFTTRQINAFEELTWKTFHVMLAVVDQLGGAMGAPGLLILPCVAGS